MGIRESLNKRPVVATAIGGSVIVLAAVLMAFQLMQRPESDLASARSFYTVDDGKTWFSDGADKLPPFTHEGKTAYRCYVFTCDGGKTKFVSHLERYTPQGKLQAEQRIKQGKTALPMMKRLSAGGLEIKKPGSGDSGWVMEGDAMTAEITMPKCPNGSTENIQPVWP